MCSILGLRSQSPLSRLIVEVGQVHIETSFKLSLFTINTYIKPSGRGIDICLIYMYIVYNTLYTHHPASRHTCTTSFYWGNLSQPALGRLNSMRNKLYRTYKYVIIIIFILIYIYSVNTKRHR